MTSPTFPPLPPIFFSTQPLLKCEVCRRYFGGIMEEMWAADTFDPRTTNPDTSNPKMIYSWFQQVATGSMSSDARQKWRKTRQGIKRYARQQVKSGRIDRDAYLEISRVANQAAREMYRPRLYLIVSMLLTTETVTPVIEALPSIEFIVADVAVEGKFPVVEGI